MVSILDETGQPALAILEMRGRHTIAIVDGRILLPGAFTVLSDAGAAAVQRAEDRACGAANLRLLTELDRI